ncbi:hypothetical protein [Zhihengliuella sp.]|uniref:hypothetical protein n=1 Tax=Zhihengliuella sp. TaxID=1954483 RepID=UPI0028118D52|nr:hypothetical protein [Zhihengliuella sp.]
MGRHASSDSTPPGTRRGSGPLPVLGWGALAAVVVAVGGPLVGLAVPQALTASATALLAFGLLSVLMALGGPARR